MPSLSWSSWAGTWNSWRGATALALRWHTSAMDPREQVNRYSAHNYHPLPVVIARGEGPG